MRHALRPPRIAMWQSCWAGCRCSWRARRRRSCWSAAQPSHTSLQTRTRCKASTTAALTPSQSSHPALNLPWRRPREARRGKAAGQAVDAAGAPATVAAADFGAFGDPHRAGADHKAQGEAGILRLLCCAVLLLSRSTAVMTHAWGTASWAFAGLPGVGLGGGRSEVGA